MGKKNTEIAFKCKKFCKKNCQDTYFFFNTELYENEGVQILSNTSIFQAQYFLIRQISTQGGMIISQSLKYFMFMNTLRT